MKKKITQNILDPWFVTGLVDGDGSFGLSISKNSKRSLGYVITLSFEVGLHSKDLDLLKGLQAYFGCGGIYKHTGEMMRYKVSSIKDITRVVIPHFELYPLVSQKRADFELFKSAVEIINKGPVSREDLQKLVNLKASFNKGLSPEFRALFPDTIPTDRPVVPLIVPFQPMWVVGFTEAEGSFFVTIGKSPRSTLGVCAKIRFVLTQHSRDERLLQEFVAFFGCGVYALRKNGLAGDFFVNKFVDLNNKIIPFFLKYPLRGSKSQSFNEFCLSAKIISEKGHLTPEGLKSLEIIKSHINKI